MCLAGAHIIGNGRASHHSLRKMDGRLEVITSAISKTGSVFLYSNQRSFDRGRLYFDGCSQILLNGDVIHMASRLVFAPDVEFVLAVVDNEYIISHGAKHTARSEQAVLKQASNPIPRIRHRKEPFAQYKVSRVVKPTPPLPQANISRGSAEEEISRGPACWLFNYLRRSGLNGFFLVLSSGADSTITLAILATMCYLVVSAVYMLSPYMAACPVSNGIKSDDVDDEEREHKRKELLRDVRGITGADSDYVTKELRELASRIVHTSYMRRGSALLSETQRRACAVAHDVESYHMGLDIV